MRAFFDTSVLVAASYELHPHHRPSLNVLAGGEYKQGFCGAHSLAEVYSSLTRMPPPGRMAAPRALNYLDSLRPLLSAIALTAEEYAATLATAADRGTVGGAIYDALLAQCALKVEADVLYTWNVRHFTRCGPEVARLVRTP